MTDAPPPLTLRHEWTDALMREVMTVVNRKSTAPPRWPRWVMPVFGFGVGALIGLGLVMTHKRLGPELMWFVFGACAMVLVWWVVSRRALRKWARGESNSPFRQGAATLTLSADGISTEHSLSDSTYLWAAVSELRDGPLALHLILSPYLSMPIPDAALPDGLAREELRRRIEHWRGAA